MRRCASREMTVRASSGCSGTAHARPSRSSDFMLRRGSRHFPRTTHTSSTGFPNPHPTAAPSCDSLRLTPLELLERLAPLIPPPRLHRHRYHGVLAPNARLRAAVVAIGRSEVERAEALPPDLHPLQTGSGDLKPSRPANPARIRWAVLLARIYGVLPLLCPGCGGQMKILAFLTDPPVVSKILLHLDLHHLPPPLSPARGPPQGDFLFDQTSGFDATEADLVPDFVFDQSLPESLED